MEMNDGAMVGLLYMVWRGWASRSAVVMGYACDWIAADQHPSGALGIVALAACQPIRRRTVNRRIDRQQGSV